MITASAKITFVLAIAAAYGRIGDTTYPLVCVATHAARESAWGTSGLAGYNNLFGVKAGSSWSGKTVDIKTKEEYTAGTLSTVNATWRVYDSYEDCLRDYYDLLSKKRYADVKNATDEVDYFQKLRDAGYFTSTTYVSTMDDWLAQVRAILKGAGLYEEGGQTDQSQSEAQEQHYEGLLAVLSDLCDYIVTETFNGVYGNGDERKKQMGEFYEVIQARVNRRARSA